MNYPRAYADLEIRIGGLQKDGYPVQLTLNDDLELTLEPGFLDPAKRPSGMPSFDQAEDGERLFGWLVADLTIKRAWDQAIRDDVLCRIRLRIDPAAADLHTLPWEALRIPASSGKPALDVAASDRTPFSRFLASSSALGHQIENERLRVLVAIADPVNLDHYGLEQINRTVELKALQEVFAGLDVEHVPISGPCTLPAIEAGLRQGYHVLHIVGHGVYRESDGAALYLAGDDNRVKVTRAGDLAAMFGRLAGPDDPPQLVFLGSCQTAATSPANAFRGLAQQLVQAGIPSVIAMQENVPEETARGFAKVFYSHLLQHGEVDLAANQARGSILTARLPGATFPALFRGRKTGALRATPGTDEPVGLNRDELLINVAAGAVLLVIAAVALTAVLLFLHSRSESAGKWVNQERSVAFHNDEVTVALTGTHKCPGYSNDRVQLLIGSPQNRQQPSQVTKPLVIGDHWQAYGFDFYVEDIEMGCLYGTCKAQVWVERLPLTRVLKMSVPGSDEVLGLQMNTATPSGLLPPHACEVINVTASVHGKSSQPFDSLEEKESRSIEGYKILVDELSRPFLWPLRRCRARFIITQPSLTP